MSFEDLYKDSTSEQISNKNDSYSLLADSINEPDITNYCFFTNNNDKPIKGTGCSISMAIRSLKKDVINQKQIELKQKNDPGSILNLLNVNPILNSLKKIYCVLKTAENKFGLDNELTDFPYSELCYIISNSQDSETVRYAIDCFMASLKFNSELVSSKIESITDETIISLSKHMVSPDPLLSKSSIQFIGTLSQYSQSLFSHFYSVGFIKALEPHLPKSYAVYAITQLMDKCNDNQALELLFLLCKSVLITEDEITYRCFFRGVNIFTKKYGFDKIPEQISHKANDTDEANTITCKNLIFALMIYSLNNCSINYQLIYYIMEFCLFIPETEPPNILANLLGYLKDTSLIKDDPKLVILVSNVVIHFYPSWNAAIPNDFFPSLYDLITDISPEYHTSFAYANLIVVYHKIQFNRFDICVIELCTQYICCSEESFAKLCLYKIIDIIESFSKNDKMNELKSYLDILDTAHSNLQEQLENPELNNDKEIRILYILKRILCVFGNEEN